MTKEIARERWPEVYGATVEEAKEAARGAKAVMFVVYDPTDANRPIHWASPVCFNEIFPRSAQVVEVIGPYGRKEAVS